MLPRRSWMDCSRKLRRSGKQAFARIYGDFSNPRSKGWADTLSKRAIIPQQQFAYTIGKNASDITLVIDAMDLLHSGRFDGFCLVSSDSDFTRLAVRIREMFSDSVSRKLRRAPGRPVESSYTRRTCLPVLRTAKMPPQLQSLFSLSVKPRPSLRRSSRRWKAKTDGCLWGR
jgi:hypothetical protein